MEKLTEIETLEYFLEHGNRCLFDCRQCFYDNDYCYDLIDVNDEDMVKARLKELKGGSPWVGSEAGKCTNPNAGLSIEELKGNNMKEDKVKLLRDTADCIEAVRKLKENEATYIEYRDINATEWLSTLATNCAKFSATRYYRLIKEPKPLFMKTGWVKDLDDRMIKIRQYNQQSNTYFLNDTQEYSYEYMIRHFTPCTLEEVQEAERSCTYLLNGRLDL